MDVLPSAISNLNAYIGGQLIGVTGEITLPDLDYMTASISGAGMGGEIDMPLVGMFPSLTMEIPFATLCDGSFSFLTLNGQQLTLRGNNQRFDVSTGGYKNESLRIVVGGIPKGLKPGKLGQASTMDGSNSLEVTYLKIEVGGAEMLELDKLNFVYKAGGVDLLAEVKNNI